MTALFKAECPHCFSTFNLKNRSSAGKKVKCKNCGEPFTVKLVGESEDEFSDVADYESELPAALPPSRSMHSASAQKKRGNAGLSIPWKPIAAVGVLIVVVVGGWIGFQSLPQSLTDTPEDLLNSYYDLQVGLATQMESIESKQDEERLWNDLKEYQTKSKDLQRRLVALAPVSVSRGESLIEYYNSHFDELKKKRDLLDGQILRLDSLGLDAIAIQNAINSNSAVTFNIELVLPFPEPRDGHPEDQFQVKLLETYRDTARFLFGITDPASVKSKSAEIEELTQRFVSLRQDLLNSGRHDRYYSSTKTDWKFLLGSLIDDLREAPGQDKAAGLALFDLSYTISFVESKQDVPLRPKRSQ